MMCDAPQFAPTILPRCLTGTLDSVRDFADVQCRAANGVAIAHLFFTRAVKLGGMLLSLFFELFLAHRSGAKRWNLLQYIFKPSFK